ncbi:hypothetical protein CerSpe_258970 [Prunus speciosa]
MEKAGGGGVGVVVSESGWPSDGSGDFTTPELAGTYNRNFLKHVTLKGRVTPVAYIEAYIFAMFNENQKPSGVERHFGLFLSKHSACLSFVLNQDTESFKSNYVSIM